MPALLVCSVLSARWQRIWPGLLHELEDLFGPVAGVHGPEPFTHTGYYDAELGAPLQRRFLAFDELLPHDRLAWAKLQTNELERRHSREDGRRLVNLDPGLLSLERLVLATGKNYTHRIYLSQGIWADLTLIYQRNKWQVLPWTFPDYADSSMQHHLLRLREHYKERVQGGVAAPTAQKPTQKPTE